MIHTIEELGEYADEHHDGKFYLWKDAENCPQSDTPWGFQFGNRGVTQYHGATPDEATKKALSAVDLDRNPDRRV